MVANCRNRIASIDSGGYHLWYKVLSDEKEKATRVMMRETARKRRSEAEARGTVGGVGIS